MNIVNNFIKRIVGSLRLMFHNGAWALVMVDKGERSAMLMSAAARPRKGEDALDHVDKLIWWTERFQHTIRRDYQQTLD